jgi:hypothetical protein
LIALFGVPVALQDARLILNFAKAGRTLFLTGARKYAFLSDFAHSLGGTLGAGSRINL